MYLGLELGGGKIFRLDDSSSIDVYGKYFYLHQNSDSFNAGGHYRVHALDSHRLRIVSRYQYDFSKNIRFSVGLGGEYEFDGRTRLTADGVSGSSAECKGFRAYGELGMAVKPEGLSGLSFVLGLKGHYGADYRDFLASAEIRYNF